MMLVEEGALWGGLLKSLVVCPTTSKFVNKDDERTMYFSVFLAVDNTVFEKIATKNKVVILHEVSQNVSILIIHFILFFFKYTVYYKIKIGILTIQIIISL